MGQERSGMMATTVCVCVCGEGLLAACCTLTGMLATAASSSSTRSSPIVCSIPNLNPKRGGNIFPVRVFFLISSANSTYDVSRPHGGVRADGRPKSNWPPFCWMRTALDAHPVIDGSRFMCMMWRVPPTASSRGSNPTSDSTSPAQTPKKSENQKTTRRRSIYGMGVGGSISACSDTRQRKKTIHCVCARPCCDCIARLLTLHGTDPGVRRGDDIHAIYSIVPPFALWVGVV